MSTLGNELTISVEEYLRNEEVATRRHEYIDGMVYAMVGANTAHHRIVTNLVIALGTQLENQRCEVFASDMKVRIQSDHRTGYYYPDVLVACHPHIDEGVYQNAPVVIVEVLSRSTQRIDKKEKRDNYLKIDSLKVYMLVEQSSATAVVYRRGDNGFNTELYRGLDAIVPLSKIACQLPLAKVYQKVEFKPEAADDELENLGRES